MPSETKENYLKAMYHLADEDGKFNLSELSKQLEVSLPTANNMIKKFQKKGWVIYEKYKPLHLSAEGRKEAALILRKHRLTEMFLTEVMDFGWEEVHEIAEELEHVKIDSFFERMDQILGFPKIDPHGSAIPNKNGVIEKLTYSKISEVPVGSCVRLRAVSDKSSELLIYLNDKGIKLGTEIEIVKREPFDQSVVINYKNIKALSLSLEICERLMVELV